MRRKWRQEVPIEVACSGRCGKVQRVRRRFIRPATYYVCSSSCEERLPKRAERLIRILDFEAAGSFRGVTDRIPFEAERASVERAKALAALAAAKIAEG